jgi:PKD repeat protein
MKLKAAITFLILLCGVVQAQVGFVAKSPFPSASRHGAVAFTTNGKGVVGTGYDGSQHTGDFCSYDPGTNSWDTINYLPVDARSAAVAFNIGNYGYVTTGTGASNLKSTYKYDPSPDLWVSRLDFGGVGRWGALSFSIGTKGYVGTGYTSGGNVDFWEYDSGSDTWTQKSNVPGGIRVGGIGFGVNGKGYAGGGWDYASTHYDDFYSYDPSCNAWDTIADFGGGARREMSGFVIGNYIFAGAGCTSSSYFKDYWVYDITSDTWKFSANLPIGAGAGRAAATGFTLNGKGYICGGRLSSSTSNNVNELWEFNPPLVASIISKTNPTCSAGNGSATVQASFGTAPYTYSWAPSGGIGTTATGLNPGTYTITVTDAISATATVTVTMSTLPTPGIWTARVGSGNSVNEAVSFSIGSKGYVGVGYNDNQFWEYDQQTATWTQKATFPGSVRQGAAGFAIASLNKGYIGTGYTGALALGDFYCWDQASNTWSTENPMSVPRFRAVGFSIGSKGYIGTGDGGGSFLNDFWEFDPGTHNWTQKASLPSGATVFAAGFVIGNKGYIGTGSDPTGTSGRVNFYEYDPTYDTWNKKADFTGTARMGAAGFAIGKKGFIGCGYDFSAPYKKDFFEWNQLTDTWTAIGSLPAGRSYPAGFSINNRGYVGFGHDGVGNFGDFYEYASLLSATLVSKTDVTCTGTNNGSATVEASGGSPSYTYLWSSGGQTTATATNLPAGNYTCTVTDCNGSVATATVAIASPVTPNNWVPKADFGGSKREFAVGFSIGTKGYMGTGLDGTYKKDFWAWDQATNAWTQKADFGGTPRYRAVGFSIGAKGYIGTGEDNTSINQKDFWEYDPFANAWTKKTDLPGVVRQLAVGFAIGNKGYIGTGANGGTNLGDFMEFDPSTNTWTTKQNFGGTPRRQSAAFSIGTKGYIGGGYDGNAYQFDFWEYDQAGNSWMKKANTPNPGRIDAVGFSIGNKGYISTGFDGGYKQDLIEWDPVANTWTSRATFIGAARSSGVGFSIGNKGYLGLGSDGGSYYNDFYEYSPLLSATTMSQTNVSCNGLKDGTATASPSGGTPPYTYSWNTSPVQNSAVAIGLGVGSYTCTITDCNGTTATATVTILQPGVSNSWTQRASVPNVSGSGRAHACSFSIGNMGYVIGGKDYTTNAEYMDMWEYNSVTNTWTQKADYAGAMIPQGRFGMVAFAIGNYGYAGTGASNNGASLHDDFYRYDPATNTWLLRQQFPGGQRHSGVGFSLNGKGYLGTGTNSSVYLNDFYEYDPQNDQWTSRASLGNGSVPGRQGAVSFTVGGKGYIATGTTISTGDQSDVWEYDPNSNFWTLRQPFAGGTRELASGFSIGTKGYITCGINSTHTYKDLWEFDPLAGANGTWANRDSITGTGRALATAFSIGNKGYLGTGSINGLAKLDFYEYNPASLSVTANFTSSGTTQTITFTNTSVNGSAYLWNFGDGTTSTLQNPVHTYALGGTYNVCLTATNNCVSSTHCSNVSFGCSVPNAGFTSGVSGLTVNFTNTTSNATSYSWNFGDGNTSALQNPSHVYFSASAYTVTLITSNGCGSDTATVIVNTNCSGATPNASYTFAQNGLSVSFNNTSPNAASSTWDFDDAQSGGSNASALNSPVHVFTHAGVYNVQLIVTNGCGVADTILQAVNVNCAPPQAQFSSHAITGSDFQFVSSGLTTGATSWTWDLGDGGTNFTPDVSLHHYASNSIFTVCLTVSNSCGSDTYCDTVHPCNSVDVTAINYTPNALNPYFNCVNTNGENYYWTFDSQNAAYTDTSDIVHHFATSGPHTVCVKATSAGCGSDSICSTITVFCSSTMNPQICMVTVDDPGMYNVVYWDKTSFSGIDSIIVYRDTANNNYVPLGMVSNDSLSQFIDTVRTKYYPHTGDPQTTSYRYKIQAMDSCGNIGPMSLWHETIHVTNTGANFNWNHYGIENQAPPISGLNNYYLMVDSFATGNYVLTAAAAASAISISDPGYASYSTTADWRIHTNWNITCTPTLRPGDSQVLTGLTKSRSNIKNNRMIGINTFTQIEEPTIYPNPASDELIVDLGKECINCRIEIINTLGAVVRSFTVHEQRMMLGTAELQNGIYYIKIKSGNTASLVKKLIVQH